MSQGFRQNVSQLEEEMFGKCRQYVWRKPFSANTNDQNLEKLFSRHSQKPNEPLGNLKFLHKGSLNFLEHWGKNYL